MSDSMMQTDLIQISSDFYLAALPILLLTVSVLVLLMQSVFARVSGVKAVFSTTIVSLVAALSILIFISNSSSDSYLYGSFILDPLAKIGQILLLVISIVVVLLFYSSKLKKHFFAGDISALFMLVVIGMLVMVATDDIISLVVGLELSSIGIYALVGYIKPTRLSQEAAIKYFILGAFASAILFFGIALLYANFGTLRISEIITSIAESDTLHWAKAGGLLLMIGLAFKFALVPFHMWAPDAYEGAPTVLTAFMATAVKVSLVVVCIRFFADGVDALRSVWQAGFVALAAMSMVFGNLMALVQNGLKRMLAYSSIAHSGYMAMAFVVMGGFDSVAVSSLLFYVCIYSIISLGVFAILSWMESEKMDNIQLEDLAGLAKRHPYICFAMMTFMISFAGLPPTAGFIAKFFIFNATISSGFYVLTLIAVLGSVISLYYYLRVVVYMYMQTPMHIDGQLPAIQLRSSKICLSIVAVAFAATLAFGTLYPNTLLNQFKVESTTSNK